MKKTFLKSGFTLIELLVVIVILGILSTISVGTFRSYFAKARDSERVSTVQNIAMMMKVDSGGMGDCSVYNYTGFESDGTTVCPSTSLESLLTDNDYKMPGPKNGLSYYYGVNIGTTDGDNEFFIVIGSEEDVPQNGKEIATSGNYIFVDGTTKGIDMMTKGAAAGGCDWDSDNHMPGCGVGWQVFPINDDGTLGTLIPAS